MEYWEKFSNFFDKSKDEMFEKLSGGLWGVFCMEFSDFCDHFMEVYHSYCENEVAYEVEPLDVSHRNATIYMLTIKEKGFYIF